MKWTPKMKHQLFNLLSNGVDRQMVAKFFRCTRADIDEQAVRMGMAGEPKTAK